MKLVGNRETVGFEIGSYWADSKQMQEINTWVKGKHIHPHDTVVYLPSFYTYLEREIKLLESKDYARPDLADKSNQELFAYFEYNAEQRVLCYDFSLNANLCFFVESTPIDFILFSPTYPYQSQIDYGDISRVEISKQELLRTLRELLDNLSNVWV